MNPREELRHLLANERPLVMPDAYDAMSARLIALAGFKAVQCSGFSMALAARAEPETKLGLERNVALTRDIVAAVKLPVIADGEDGYGPPAAIAATVRAFVAAGVAGINLEDQVLPPSPAKQIVPVEVMVAKLRVARETAATSGARDLVLNARTDALMAGPDRVAGLQTAIERGNQYLAAGADLVFVIGVNTPEEARDVTRGIHGPVSIAAGLPNNLRTLSLASLRACGVARISLPSVAVFATVRAVSDVLGSIQRTGELDDVIARGLLADLAQAGAICAR